MSQLQGGLREEETGGEELRDPQPGVPGSGVFLLLRRQGEGGSSPPARRRLSCFPLGPFGYVHASSWEVSGFGGLPCRPVSLSPLPFFSSLSSGTLQLPSLAAPQQPSSSRPLL